MPFNYLHSYHDEITHFSSLFMLETSFFEGNVHTIVKQQQSLALNEYFDPAFHPNLLTWYHLNAKVMKMHYIITLKQPTFL